jgi:hypothetical protein
MSLDLFSFSSILFFFQAFLLLQVKFHANYPEQSPLITILDSANVDDTSSFENEIHKIVGRNIYE